MCGPSREFAATRQVMHDAVAVKRALRDPTGTMPLQNKFCSAMDARWRTLKNLVVPAVRTRFGAPTAETVTHAAMTGDDPLRAFQVWFDEAIRQTVLGTTPMSWTSTYIAKAASMGAERAAKLTDTDATPSPRVSLLQTLTIAELQGVCEAVSQRAVRALAQGQLTMSPPATVARQIADVIDAVGKNRSHQLVSFMVVRAFNAATLDGFRASGITHVGTVAERVRLKQDPSSSGLTRKLFDAKKKKKWAEPDDLVQVLTAGDDDVCPVCEEISESGPYTLDDAEGLIPSHPSCRCSFTPAWDKRFASVHDYDPDEPRDDHGMWTGGAYHGSGQPYESKTGKELYLTNNPKDASDFARGVHLGGTGVDPQVHKFAMQTGKTKNIDDKIQDAMESGDDLQETIDKVVAKERDKKSGASYLSFSHPSVEGDDIPVLIALHSERDLKHLSTARLADKNAWQKMLDQHEKKPTASQNKVATPDDDAPDWVKKLRATAPVPRNDIPVVEQTGAKTSKEFSAGGSIADVLKNAVPELKYFKHFEPEKAGFRQGAQRTATPHYWVLASTHAYPATGKQTIPKPETTPGGNVATGIAMKINPQTKHIHFEDLNSHIKGAGMRMVEAIIKKYPDYKFSTVDVSRSSGTGAKTGQSFWSKVQAKYPTKFVVNDAFNPDQERDDHGMWSSVGGPALKSWRPPQSNEEWKNVAGQDRSIHEPPLPSLKQKPYSYVDKKTGETRTVQPNDLRLSSGVIMREADGRTWLLHPKNGFGGYKYTFPKGGVEEGLHPQANAIKEAFEETGLKARITGFAGDYRGDTSITRMYHAVREDGHPKDHGWETDHVALAASQDLDSMLNRSRDRKIASDHIPGARPVNDVAGQVLYRGGGDGKNTIGTYLTTDKGFASGYGSVTAHKINNNVKIFDLDHPGAHKVWGNSWWPTDKEPTTSDKMSLFGSAGASGDDALRPEIHANIQKAGFHGIALSHGMGPGHTRVFMYPGHTKLVTQDEFNPDEPRDDHGMWTSGGASISMSDLTKISGKKGSNEGGVYSPNSGDLNNLGKQYYIKQPATPDHVTNELLTAKLYQLAGANTLNYVPVEGGAHVATELEPLAVNNVKNLSPGERKEAQNDFAIHAWLANWDAAGTGGDNVGVTKNGVTTLDTGGGLKYRAQGEPKGAAFGDKVTETSTLRDPQKNYDAAKLFGDMTNDQMVASIKRVKAISDGDIIKTVIKNGGTMSLANQLIARKDDLSSQAMEMQVSSLTALAPKTILGPSTTATPLVFKTKMEHIKHLLLKGATADELKSAVNWPSMNVPGTAEKLGLKLTKTKIGGGKFHYKGEPIAGSVVALAVASTPDTKPLHTAFQEDLKKAGVFSNISPHDNDAMLQISSATENKVKMAEIAKSHSQWLLKPNNVATYSAPKAAFSNQPGDNNPEFVTWTPKSAAPAHDISTPVGNFKASLDEHGVKYEYAEGADTHYIGVAQSRLQKAKEIANWHPLVNLPFAGGDQFTIAKALTTTPTSPPTILGKTAPPVPAPVPPTDAELAKAQKNVALKLQYVPGAPDVPEAHALIAEFNKTYEGKTLAAHELPAKVEAFKKLQADMIPLQSAQQQEQAAKQAKLVSMAKASLAEKEKIESDKIANLHNLPEEDQREYWLKKITQKGHWLEKGKADVASKPYLQAAGITPAEVGFVRAFTGPYSHVNEAMRHGHMDESTFAFKHIMHGALDKLPKYDGDKVWRKITLDASEQAKYVPGQIAEWKAFNSTSKNPDTWSGNTHFIIHKPKTGVDVQKISSNPSEAEVIMPANTFYKVLSKKQSGGTTYIEMEEVLPFGKKLKKAA